MKNVEIQLAKKRPNAFGFFISKFLGVQPIFSKRMMFNIKTFWKTLAFWFEKLFAIIVCEEPMIEMHGYASMSSNGSPF
jgi:hypothetical protein